MALFVEESLRAVCTVWRDELDVFLNPFFPPTTTLAYVSFSKGRAASSDWSVEDEEVDDFTDAMDVMRGRGWWDVDD